jgi:hypothetical protein
MSTIKATTLSTQSNATVSIDTVVNGTAKAWVNFNGTGTVAIRASFNVASITDNGVGIYAVNFTTAMPDANYSGLVTGGDLGTVGRAVGGSSNASRTTTSFAVRTLNETQVSLTDCDTVYVAIFR